MHNNPVLGRWNLSRSHIDYVHSSFYFYDTGDQGVYEVVDYRDLDFYDESGGFWYTSCELISPLVSIIDTQKPY